uniref:Uncharacterized protein n=1 Tax=Leersia perrieri TaxID=77586 RepID=A0A0D9WPS9_9ORYZ
MPPAKAESASRFFPKKSERERERQRRDAGGEEETHDPSPRAAEGRKGTTTTTGATEQALAPRRDGGGGVSALSRRAARLVSSAESDRIGSAMSTKSGDSAAFETPSSLIARIKVLCKFFMHGACLKGEYCEFSHDWSDQPNNVCTFYQKGACSYGSRCRYDHVKVSRNPTVPPPASSSTSARTSSSLQPLGFGRLHHMGYQADSNNPRQQSPHHVGYQADSSSPREQISMDLLAHSGSKPVWRNDYQHESVLEDWIDWSSNRTVQNQTTLNPADLPICSFAAAGNCPYGEECPQMHGDLCTTCGKMCLHPYRPDEREEHNKLCEKNHNRLETLKRSQEIECSVCLDRVLSKPTAAERKFGLLSECDHPFCISCIRNWRNNSPTSGMDVNSALRACPICRKLSYYVIPSVLWYFSKEEKLEIIENYKSKLKSIDCKYFDFGTGTCPFGSSCFYKHAYRDGRLEEVILRHLDADDGSTVIAKNIRLSDFLSRLRL